MSKRWEKREKEKIKRREMREKRKTERSNFPGLEQSVRGERGETSGMGRVYW